MFHFPYTVLEFVVMRFNTSQPKLWSTPPKAIISLYGPTDFHKIPYLNLGPRRPEVWPIPDASTCLLTQATDFSTPPTELPMPTKIEDFKMPRHYMGQHIYRGEILGDFLVKGLVRYVETVDGRPTERLRLPGKGESKLEEIDDISESTCPLFSSKKLKDSNQSRPIAAMHQVPISTNLPTDGNSRSSI